MYKKIIKYFIFYILPMNFLFAQESGLNKDYSHNNVSANKTEFRVHENLTNNDLSRSNEETKTTINNIRIENYDKEIRKSFLDYILGTKPFVNSHERSEKNLITSISDNIEMGGISGKFAVMSFTPKLSIEPVNFISISANQYVRCLIPIKNIDEHVKLLFFQSTYIIAIDNFMNFLSKKPTIIQNIVGFIAKNIIPSLVNRLNDNNSKSKIYSITSYYYSIKIKL